MACCQQVITKEDFNNDRSTGTCVYVQERHTMKAINDEIGT
jgi:hypothetical protein